MVVVLPAPFPPSSAVMLPGASAKEMPATAVVVSVEGMMAPAKTSFRADHPFAWIIRDLQTGEILFYGRVVDPR